MQPDTTEKRILRYLESGRVHPSLLLLGPNKEVKFQTAIKIAKFLLCKTHVKNLFCNTCAICRRIDKGLHPDVLVFGHAEEGLEEDGQLKVDLVREITRHMEVSSLEGGNKVCIVDEFNRMNIPAQNAFLKTLEEPGEGRFFILLASQAGVILPTISSRCLEFIFKPEAEAPVLDAESRETYSSLVKAMQESRSVYGVTKELTEKEEVIRFVHYLQHELRNEQLAKYGLGISSLFSHRSSHELSQIFENTVAFEGQLRSNAAHGLMLETFLRENILAS